MMEAYLSGIEQSLVAYDADELVFTQAHRSLFLASDLTAYPLAAVISTSESSTGDFATHPCFVEFRKLGVICGRVLIP